MKKLVLFIFFSFFLNSMEENNPQLVNIYQNINKKDKSVSLSDIKKKYVLSLKTLTALISSLNFFKHDKANEKQIQNTRRLLQELPEGLANFIIVCNQLSKIKLTENSILTFLQIIHPEKNPRISSLSSLKSLLFSSLSGYPLLALTVINFSKEQPDQTLDITSFTVAIIKAIASENLIDMGLDSCQMIEEYENNLAVIDKEIDNNQINLNKPLKKLRNVFGNPHSEFVLLHHSTLLSFAAELIPEQKLLERKFRTLTYLLSKGANINAYSAAILESISAPDLVLFLCDNGANPNLYSDEELTEFERSIDDKQFDKAKIFLQYSDTNINDLYVLSKFSQAICQGGKDGIETVKFFLDNDANIYLEDIDSLLPFEVALSLVPNGNKTALMVIEQALLIKPRGNFIRIIKAIYYSPYFKHKEVQSHTALKLSIIKAIFIKTNSLNDMDDAGNTPLIAACYLNLTELAKAFIENGANK